MDSLNMNGALSEPLKVFIVNPLAPASQLFIVKMMSGGVFGNDQLIDLNLIVYVQDIKTAKVFILELESCGFSCANSIRVSSELPSASEGDVFCVMTDFANPNMIDFDKENMDDRFKTLLYLIIKLANSLILPNEADFVEIETSNNKNDFKKNISKRTKFTKSLRRTESRPLFVADGIVVIDILWSFSKNIPMDLFLCPTPITSIAKSVLGDYLNVQYNVLNEIFVWGATDNVFHIEIEKPVILYGNFNNGLSCNRDNVIDREVLESMNLDSTQFSASWLRKEFIEKVASSVSKNPYGCIYRAVEFSKTLRDIWLTRIRDDGKKVYNNMGVISDGSLGTIKGLAYTLPIVLSNSSWSVNKIYEENIHLKQEIKRINKEVIRRHDQMISYCKKFLQENIINQHFSDENGSSSSRK